MTRTNLLLNGAFRSGVTGWTAEQATISADSGRMRVIPSSSSWTVSSDSTPVTPGQWVSLAADITAGDSPVDLCLRFAGTDGPAPRASAPAGSTGRVVVTAQAPAGATTVQAALSASTGGVAAAYPPLSSRDAWELGAAVQAADGVAAGAWVVPAGADVSDGKATVTGTLSMGVPAAAVAGHTLGLSWSASTSVAGALVQRGGFYGVTADGILKKSYLARGFQGLTDTETTYQDSVTIPSAETLAEDGVEVVYPVVFLAAGVTFTRIEVVDETTQTLWADNTILQLGDTQRDVSDTSFFDGDTRPVRIGDTGKALVYSWTGVPGGSPSREEVGRWPIFTLTAIIPDGDAPVVQVIVPGLYARSGTQLRVTGHAENGFSWTVRGSGSMGNDSQLVLGDALAPVNTPLTYRIVRPWDGQTVESTPVTRPWSGRSLMTDVLGGGRLDLIWQGDDSRAPDQRITAHEIPGRPTPVMVFAPVMGAGTVSLTARTSGAHTQTMTALAARPTIAVLFHNPARCFQCRRGVCDVPLTTVMALTSVSQARTPRQDQAERAWTIKGTICSVPEPQRIVGLSVWDDFDAAALTWVRLDAMGLSWDDFDATIWQEVR